MPIQVMVEDSGGPGQGPVQVMAGLVGRAEEWATFADKWAACLSKTPTLPVFKMRHAANCSGHFRGFTPAQRDDRLIALASIVNEYAFELVHVTLEMPGFETTFKRLDGGPRALTKPYFHAFYLMIVATCFGLLERGQRERFEIIFDEHLSLGPKVKVWYPELRRNMPADAQAILPIEPEFKDDAEFLPLQAADMMAWFCRRNTSGQAHAFGWLTHALTKVRVSPWSQHLNEARMQRIVARFDAIHGPTVEEML